MKPINNILQTILDIIAPPNPLVRKVENIGVEGLLCLKEIKQDSVATSLFPYRNELIKASVVEIKEVINKKIVRILAEAVYLLIKDRDLFPVVMVPVPMTAKAKRVRGWNQCELIARQIEKIDKGKLLTVRTDILIKTRETGDQVGKGRDERISALKDCFGVRDKVSVVGMSFIILDDVITTGTTLSEARKALLDSGALRVSCISISR